MRDVRTLDGSGNLGEDPATEDDEDEIPDMEDDDDDEEAIIRDTAGRSGGGPGSTKAPLRTYNLYITYTPYYRTPRFYLSGYSSPSEPLPPSRMLEDIVGDYKDKTVTLEDFPFFEQGQGVKMASVHPCRHASVMKSLLERADAAVRLRRDKDRRALLREGGAGQEALQGTVLGMEGLVDDTQRMGLAEGRERGDKGAYKAGVAAAGGSGGDEWEVLQHEADGGGEEESAIRVDQYLVVFLKFAATLAPSVEWDFTTGI